MSKYTSPDPIGEFLAYLAVIVIAAAIVFTVGSSIIGVE